MAVTTKKIRWGILGTGWIANQFALGLQQVPDSTLAAVASRSLDSAQQFAQRLDVPNAYGSYEQLVQSDLDVVYVATPHTRHRQDCILCLEAGKAVLCEKPFMLNAREAQEVIAIAQSRQLFCMEAMWMRFLPLVVKVRDLIKAGEIGEVRSLTADFGYPTEFNPTNRFFNRDLGGGALLDRGVYPLSLAFFLLGQPEEISGTAHIGRTGVDEQSAMLLKYENGALAVLSSTLQTYAANTATIIGTRGKIVMQAPFYQPEQIALTRFPDTTLVKTAPAMEEAAGLKDTVKSVLKKNPFVRRLRLLKPSGAQTMTMIESGNPYRYQAAEVARCLRNGQTESLQMPLNETLQILQAMDSLRQSWQLSYPQE